MRVFAIKDETLPADRDLHDAGETVPLAQADFLVFVRRRLLSTAEAAQMLGCSRQNINDLTKRGKLHPIRSDER